VLILFGISVVADSGDPPPVPALDPTSLLPKAALSQPIQSPSPSPGVYSAAPYSMVVVVPESVDPGMIVAAGANSSGNMPCLKPDFKLERR
jgi:hypothetical protein